MLHYLVITITESNTQLYHDQVLNELLSTIDKFDCNIIKAHHKHYGSLAHITWLLEGSWNTIAKVESWVNKLSLKYQIRLEAERTEQVINLPQALPHMVQIMGIDKPGIMTEVYDFFTTEDLIILDLEMTNHIAPQNGTKIFTINILTLVPDGISLSELRERFILLCDELNVDGLMEAVK
ncbi:MAG: hypothetical protein Tsb005_07820 [Gammaproteobacteria bacterium]